MRDELRRSGGTFQFLNPDRTPHQRQGRPVGPEDLLDALGPALFVVVGEELQPVPAWNLTAMRRLAADAAAHVLPLFAQPYPADDRPRRAVEAARRGPSRVASLAAARAAVAASADAMAASEATPEEWRSETISVRERYAALAAAAWAARAAARAARTRDAAGCQATLAAAREAARLAGLGAPQPGVRATGGILFKTPGRQRSAHQQAAAERAWQADRLWELIGGG